MGPVDKIKYEELISAYLDGELDPLEKERTEIWITENPQAQKLLDDLQKLRGAIQELPAHRLDGDIKKQVLEQIIDQPIVGVSPLQEGELLSTQDASLVAPMMNSCSHLDSRDDSPIRAQREFACESPQVMAPRIPERRRIYLWPVAAIVVAVLLMVYSQRQSDQMIVRKDATSLVESSLPQMSLMPAEDQGIDVQTQTQEQPFRTNQMKPDRKAVTKQSTRANNDDLAPGAFEESATAEQYSQATPFGKGKTLTTYIYKTDSAVAAEGQLEKIARHQKNIRVIDLGVIQRNATKYHVFELYGALAELKPVTDALKDVQGVIFDSKKILRNDVTVTRKDMKKSIRSINESEILKKDEAFKKPASDCIRILFVLPSR